MKKYTQVTENSRASSPFCICGSRTHVAAQKAYFCIPVLLHLPTVISKKNKNFNCTFNSRWSNSSEAHSEWMSLASCASLGQVSGRCIF